MELHIQLVAPQKLKYKHVDNDFMFKRYKYI